MMRIPIVTSLLVLATSTASTAQVSPYAGEPPRDIKALSAEEVAGLLDGAGLGYARAAELNGVPGPRHVLDMAGDLHLDERQRIAIAGVFARMQSAARALGERIVEGERRLDALFASGAADAASVVSASAEIARLDGELRAVHLNAHLETAALLDRHQIARYAELRGYSAERDGAAAGHEAHH